MIDGTGRLARATGRDDIAVSRGGVPVTMVHDLEDFGKPVCARTLRNGNDAPVGIELHANPPAGYCRDLTSEFIHEAMHAMAPEAEHADSGIFAPAANPTVWIDDASLATFCSEFECAVFMPESDPAAVCGLSFEQAEAAHPGERLCQTTEYRLDSGYCTHFVVCASF